MPRGSPSEVTQPAETALPRRGKVKAKRKARRDEPTGAHEYNSKGTEMPGEADIGASEVEAVPETTGKKKLSTEALSDFNEKERRRGIIYMSRVPPFMKPMKVRHHMEQYGKVGKLFLRPEDTMVAKKRKKFGGNKKTNYVEGWVEFEDKKVAKRVAATLNGTNVGGKKGSFHYDDQWTMLYLPKFKWHHLTERIAYDNAVRLNRLRTEDAQVRRETNVYVDQVAKARRDEKKGDKREGDDMEAPKRRIKMRKPIVSQEV